MTLDVLCKRIYDPPDASDGYRILIDHIWPRGVSRDRACLGRLTILYAARDRDHNNAVVLTELLRDGEAADAGP